MKGLVLALVLGVSGSLGLAGVATSRAEGPTGDAAGFWAWLIANSPAEEPIDCCPVGGAPLQPCEYTPAPALFCDFVGPAGPFAGLQFGN